MILLNVFITIKCEYYSLDGTNNNLEHRYWGTGNQAFRRLPNEYIHLSYLDKSHEIDNSLPNPRIISNAMGQIPAAQSLYDSYAPLSGIAWVFSKTISQEMCKTDIRKKEDSFYPIKVPPCDWFLDNQCNNNTIIPFFRASYINNIKPNTLNSTYRTPINKATSFIDLHYLYGTTEEEHYNDIRVGYDGLIKTDAYSTNTADELVNMLLNLDDESKLFTFYNENNINNIHGSRAGINTGIAGYRNTKCPIIAGEGSTRFTLISHLYRLEHNRIARELKYEYGWKNDEYLFQESRARLIATAQHIVYTEYLPLFLAYPVINEVIENGYDASIDPTVSTWFCGIAHRYAHPATPHSIPFGGYHDINNNNKLMYGGYANEQISAIPIRDALKYPCFGIDQIKNDQDHLNDNVYIESMLAGLMLESERLIAPQIIEDLRSYLQHGLTTYVSELINDSFAINISEYTDLFALDIFRARDIGLPKYNDARELFNLSRIQNWNDLTDNEWYLEILPLLYGVDGIDNLDVYVGALVERLEADNIETSTGSGHVGQLMAAILRDQYKRAAMGDRLFYIFNETLRNYTKDITLSRIIELNTNLKNLSTDIFTADAKNYQHYVTENEKNERKAVLLRGRLQIKWEINENNNYIDIVFTLNGCGDGCDIGWIGIGFGVGQYMKGKDIIKMNFDRLNDDMHSFDIIDSHSPSNQWLPVPDKISNVEMLNGSFIGEDVMISIRRPLAISDINEDYPILLNQEQDIIFAFNTHSNDKHNTKDRTPGRINWSLGEIYETQINILDNVRFNHGILMILLFGICYPISAFFARYLKHFAWSRDKHKISAKLGLTTALTSAYMAMSTVQDRGATTHGKLGLCCIILLIFQVCIGYTIDYWLRNKTRGFIYQKVHYFHLFVAFCILSISPITIWSGWNELALYNIPILQQEYIWYIFIFLVIIIGELYIHIWPRFASKGAMNQSAIHNYHIYSWSEVSQNVSSGASWIIINDHIYDVTEWQHSHPGGRQLLLHYVGTDCTDFFNGLSNVGYAHGNIKHQHSDYAKKQLIQMIVGQISKSSTKSNKDDHNNDDGILLFDVAGDNMHRITSGDSYNYESNQSISVNKGENHALRLKIITLINKQRLNKVKHTINSRKVVLFEFDYNVKENGIKFDGDYILLHHVDKNTVTRAYTPINPEFVLLNGCAFYKSPNQDKSDINSSKYNVLHQQNRLFLIIKLYKKGRMSQILSSLAIGHTIRITGPFRREKMFPSIHRIENDIELDYGQYCWRRIVLICGGTGITPMFNALYSHLKYGNDECKVNLIWCNKTLNDVFYEDTLKYCKMMYFNRFWIDLKFDIAIISEKIKDTKDRLKWARLHTQQWHKLEIVQMIRYFFKNGIPLNCDLDSIKLKQLSEEHTIKKLNRQISVDNIRRKFKQQKGQKNDKINHRYSSISVISQDDNDDNLDNNSDEKHSQYIQVNTNTNSDYNKTEEILELQSIDSYYVKLTSLHQHDRIIISGPKPFVDKIRNAIQGAPDLKQLRIDKQLICLD